jgi:hypothetical protein
MSSSRVIVKNNHHFASGITLTIVDQKNLEWDFGHDLMDGTDGVIQKLTRIFRFTGTGPTFDIAGSFTNQQVIDLIYAQPLEFHVKFIDTGRCKCGKAACSVTYYEQPKTYGDVIALFGSLTVQDGVNFYE